jgi:transcription elongation factor GreA
MNKLFKLTQDGIDELKAELDTLIAERPEITERIKTAREMGDLSENAEYASARNEQDKCEARITEVEFILKNVELIKSPKASGVVSLGSTVKLKGAGKEKEFKVVGTVEADPMLGKISDESPIGKALMGKKVGDSVEIVTPAETATFKIVSIS